MSGPHQVFYFLGTEQERAAWLAAHEHIAECRVIKILHRNEYYANRNPWDALITGDSTAKWRYPW